MKKIIPFFLIVFSFLLQLPAFAQPKQKAETAFVNQLNTILKNSKQQHWAYEGSTMLIDSAFAISQDGILSVTVRYTNDSSFTRVRMEAPIQKVKEVTYDLYLILKYKDYDVSVFESAPGSNELKELNKTYFFHIGAPEPEDISHQEKLQQALDKVLKYYQ